MDKNIVVLEKWRKGGFINRLVTDGKKMQLQWWSSYRAEWRVDSDPINQKAYLKVFK